MPMSDETRHIREILDERDRRYEQRFQGQEKALGESKEDLKARLDLLNELREGVATRAELAALEKVVEDLRDRINLREGKTSGFSSGWGILLGAVGLIAAVIAIIGTR